MRTKYDYEEHDGKFDPQNINIPPINHSKQKGQHFLVKETSLDSNDTKEQSEVLKRKSLEAQIAKFLKSGEESYEFPPSLTSYQRMLVHDICDSRGLSHISLGDNHQRQIIISRKKTRKEVSATLHTSDISTASVEDLSIDAEAAADISATTSTATFVPFTCGKERNREMLAANVQTKTNHQPHNHSKSPVISLSHEVSHLKTIESKIQTNEESDVQRMLRQRRERLQQLDRTSKPDDFGVNSLGQTSKSQDSLVRTKKSRKGRTKQFANVKIAQKPGKGLSGKSMVNANCDILQTAQRRTRRTAPSVCLDSVFLLVQLY